MGVNQSGYKEVLGMYVGEHEGARFWLGVLDNLRSRGIRDILIACIDNLKGFAEAIQTVFPATDVQACVVHQVRNSLNCVPYKYSKEPLQDMKSIYQSNNLEQVETALDRLAEKWGKSIKRSSPAGKPIDPGSYVFRVSSSGSTSDLHN